MCNLYNVRLRHAEELRARAESAWVGVVSKLAWAFAVTAWAYAVAVLAWACAVFALVWVKLFLPPSG